MLHPAGAPIGGPQPGSCGWRPATGRTRLLSRDRNRAQGRYEIPRLRLVLVTLLVVVLAEALLCGGGDGTVP
jgi:hypothetical protein